MTAPGVRALPRTRLMFQLRRSLLSRSLFIILVARYKIPGEGFKGQSHLRIESWSHEPASRTPRFRGEMMKFLSIGDCPLVVKFPFGRWCFVSFPCVIKKVFYLRPLRARRATSHFA